MLSYFSLIYRSKFIKNCNLHNYRAKYHISWHNDIGPYVLISQLGFKNHEVMKKKKWIQFEWDTYIQNMLKRSSRRINRVSNVKISHSIWFFLSASKWINIDNKHMHICCKNIPGQMNKFRMLIFSLKRVEMLQSFKMWLFYSTMFETYRFFSLGKSRATSRESTAIHVILVSKWIIFLVACCAENHSVLLVKEIWKQDKQNFTCFDSRLPWETKVT